jgi:hypothetical protein
VIGASVLAGSALEIVGMEGGSRLEVRHSLSVELSHSHTCIPLEPLAERGMCIC